MKTLIVQSYRDHDVPGWIERCLVSVRNWARSKGYDYRLTGDEIFALCGDDYLAAVGDNMRSITNLCRLELIKLILAEEGYDRVIWMDADIFVFAPDRLDFAPGTRIAMPLETWLWHADGEWKVRRTLNNCVVVCPKGDPDIDLFVQATRHRARHHPVTHNHELGVHLIRGMYEFLRFELLTNVGMFSNEFLIALVEGDQAAIRLQALEHQTPVYAANICASDHLWPTVPEAQAHAAMDLLERTGGDVVNSYLGA